MKTLQALLTAIVAAALSFAVVIGTAATMASEQDAASTSLTRQPIAASTRKAIVPHGAGAGLNTDG